MKQPILFLFVLLAISQSCFALSYGTPDGTFAECAALRAEWFAEQHEGSSPTSWNDLEMPDKSLDEQFYYLLPTKRYAFISQQIHLPPPHEGELLIITRRPFRNVRLYTSWYGSIKHGLSEPCRYIVYRTKEGQFRSGHLNEEDVPKVFRGLEMFLPTPDNEPERSFVSHARESRGIEIAIWSGITIAAVFVVARLVLKRGLLQPRSRN